MEFRAYQCRKSGVLSELTEVTFMRISKKEFLCSKDWKSCVLCRGEHCEFKVDLDSVDVCTVCGNILPNPVKEHEFVCDICKCINQDSNIDLESRQQF